MRRPPRHTLSGLYGPLTGACACVLQVGAGEGDGPRAREQGQLRLSVRQRARVRKVIASHLYPRTRDTLQVR